MNLLVFGSSPGRVDDAILILETCQKLDPYNGQITDMLGQLKRSKIPAPAAEQIKQAFAQIQENLSQGQTNAAEAIWTNCSISPARMPTS